MINASNQATEFARTSQRALVLTANKRENNRVIFKISTKRSMIFLITNFCAT